MMTDDQKVELSRTLIATYEIMGAQCGSAAIRLMVEDLCAYTVPEVSSALARCRRELKGRMTLSDVLDRIPSANPFLPANEAWALALTSIDEHETVVWTDEMAAAMGDARPILSVGDKVGARMAFISSYERRVDAAKSSGCLPRWSASLGQDPARRQTAIEDALSAGKISAESARGLLPSPERVDALLALPPSPEEEERRRRKSQAVLKELKQALSTDTKRELAKHEREERRRMVEIRRNELAQQAIELKEGQRTG